MQHSGLPAGSRTSIAFSFFTATATTEIYTLSLHDALPICFQRRHSSGGVGAVWEDQGQSAPVHSGAAQRRPQRQVRRSEEHTSELQSHVNLVCRLLLEKKK